MFAIVGCQSFAENVTLHFQMEIFTKSVQSLDFCMTLRNKPLFHKRENLFEHQSKCKKVNLFAR